jgi:hypothetical protein
MVHLIGLLAAAHQKTVSYCCAIATVVWRHLRMRRIALRHTCMRRHEGNTSTILLRPAGVPCDLYPARPRSDGRCPVAPSANRSHLSCWQYWDARRRCEISSGKSSSILRIAPTSICSALLNIIFRMNFFVTYAAGRCGNSPTWSAPLTISVLLPPGDVGPPWRWISRLSY